MKERNTVFDAETLRNSGYRINYRMLYNITCDSMGKPLDELTREFWKAALPLFINIYQAGLKGRPLSSILTFVEEMKV